MRLSLFLIILFVLIFRIEIFGQNPKNIFDNYLVYPIQSTSSEKDTQEFSFLKEVLKGNRFILLGEQSHGDGATFDAKVRLIKYLHQELGYEVLCFESGLYENFKAFQKVNELNVKDSPLKGSIYRIWSDTKEFEPLLKYIHSQSISSRPLIIAGFDCQEEEDFILNYLSDLRELLGQSLRWTQSDLSLFDQVISSGPEFIYSNSEDSVQFFNLCKKIKKNLDKLMNETTSEKSKVVIQTFESWTALIKWQLDMMNEVEIKVQNPRDLQMAKNFIFLSSLYPHKKFIAWGASYHFANRIETYQNTDLTKLFSHRLDSLQHNEDPFNLDKAMDGAVPMGRILKEYFGSSIYSLSFSSLEGYYGMLGFDSTSLSPIRPPEGSIEDEINKKGYSSAFVNYEESKNKPYFYSSVLGNLPIYAPWGEIFNGLFYIKTSFAPSFPTNISTSNKSVKEYVNPQIIEPKKLQDEQTKEAISYANVYLLYTSQGVATNLNGEFRLNIPDSNPDDKVIFSCIGYETDTLTVNDLLSRTVFELIPKSNMLSPVVVHSKPLSAKEIIRKAENKIEENYYQHPHNQEFFYHVKDYSEDSVSFDEEASVLVYNPDGFESNKKGEKNLKGEILQIKTTKDNSKNNIWNGAGSLWLMYAHDVIMTKYNVLHHPQFYDLTLNGITSYENNSVYDISFDCNKPGDYSTGFGYPAPKSATGKIFIDVDTYAVLKFEILIHRKPYKRKKRSDVINDPNGHYLVQTYKEFNGKYFLNYSKQVHFSNWVNTKTNTSERSISIREMLSTEIETKEVIIPQLSLSNIKSVKTEYDEAFWRKHNIFIEDNLSEIYKLVEPKNND